MVILFARNPVGDVAIDDNESRTILGSLEGLEGPVEHFEVVGIADAGDVPAEADEARGHVFAEGPRGVPSMVILLLS